MATRRNAPNLHPRILVSTIDKGPDRPAHNLGDVGRNSRSSVEPSWVNAAEKSASCPNSMPARAKGLLLKLVREAPYL